MKKEIIVRGPKQWRDYPTYFLCFKGAKSVWTKSRRSAKRFFGRPVFTCITRLMAGDCRNDRLQIIEA